MIKGSESSFKKRSYLDLLEKCCFPKKVYLTYLLAALVQQPLVLNHMNDFFQTSPYFRAHTHIHQDSLLLDTVLLCCCCWTEPTKTGLNSLRKKKEIQGEAQDGFLYRSGFYAFLIARYVQSCTKVVGTQKFSGL